MNGRQGDIRGQKGSAVRPQLNATKSVRNKGIRTLNSSNVGTTTHLSKLLPMQRAKPGPHVMPNSSPRTIIRSLMESRTTWAGGERRNAMTASSAGEGGETAVVDVSWAGRRRNNAEASSMDSRIEG